MIIVWPWQKHRLETHYDYDTIKCAIKRIRLRLGPDGDGSLPADDLAAFAARRWPSMQEDIKALDEAADRIAVRHGAGYSK
jgi:hypothetical protein